MILLILSIIWLCSMTGFLIKNYGFNNISWHIVFSEAMCGLFVLITTVLSINYIIHYFIK